MGWEAHDPTHQTCLFRPTFCSIFVQTLWLGWDRQLHRQLAHLAGWIVCLSLTLCLHLVPVPLPHLLLGGPEAKALG